MAVDEGHDPITNFEAWYLDYEVDSDGCLRTRGLAPFGQKLVRLHDRYKREADRRLEGYEPLELLADSQVISPRPDLPNISSGETAGLVRRTARALVQNTPNVEIISKFDDDSLQGIFAMEVLKSKIIGSDQYSNDMQQNLFASTKMSFTLGFDCVVPVLLRQANGSWYMEYDTIHYRDVFADPGCKDVRQSHSVFIRRYLTTEEVQHLIQTEAPGWDPAALKRLLRTRMPSRKHESTPLQTKKHHIIPEGYEILTWYSDSGEPFLTFEESTKMLLRVEKNKHPLKHHPVHFLVLEKDDLQPYGKSQVELIMGRQDFQDLMLNGAMKQWYRNINPAIIGYGTMNAMPNLSPGKYTEISNPNAKLVPFEVNTQTLLQFGQISLQNNGAMLGIVGAPDQQTASQGIHDQMSATPQGVEAQQRVVDVTTNNYQKAIEGFFSRYCSYALSTYFAELKALESVELSADGRLRILKAAEKAGLDEEAVFNDDGTLKVDMKEMATDYYVRCIPGSLVEMEDEKQMRMLNELFIPLSQAMSGLAATQNPELINQAALAMQFIVSKQIELSGSTYSTDLNKLWMEGDMSALQARDEKIAGVELALTDVREAYEAEQEQVTTSMTQMQEQIRLLTENNQILLEKLGIQEPASEQPINNSEAPM